VWTLASGFRRHVRNWWAILPMLWLAMPTRLSPHGGIPRLARHVVTLRLRDGFVARCRLDELFSFVGIYVLGEYDAEDVSWRDVTSIVDVGANVGAATLWFARRAPRAVIVAIEPDADVAGRLTWNISRNGLASRVHVINAAAGETAGHGLVVRDGSSVYNRVAVLDRGGESTVAVLPLHELLESLDIPAVDVLKLDCEGAEAAVLRGLGDLRRVAVIVGEWHAFDADAKAELAAILGAAGFDAEFRGQGDAGMFTARRD
jgi:FkbM family methyltransferase